MKRTTLIAILLIIFFAYHITILTMWPGWPNWPVGPAHYWFIGPGSFLWSVAIVGITTFIAARYLPKEEALIPKKASLEGSSEVKRKIILITSREAGMIAAFSGVNFAWNALGLIIVIFPPGSWSLTGIAPHIVGMATGPVGLIIAHFIGGLLWYDFPWGTYNFMLSGTWLPMIAYWYIRDVKKAYRYPLIFTHAFVMHQYDVYSWALWAVHFAKLAPLEYIIPACYVFIGPWSLLNAIPITIIASLLDRFAPGLLRPTWLERLAT